jgi:hypothetical protein
MDGSSFGELWLEAAPRSGIYRLIVREDDGSRLSRRREAINRTPADVNLRTVEVNYYSSDRHPGINYVQVREYGTPMCGATCLRSRLIRTDGRTVEDARRKPGCHVREGDDGTWRITR